MILIRIGLELSEFSVPPITSASSLAWRLDSHGDLRATLAEVFNTRAGDQLVDSLHINDVG
jgi:hypothetical protein